jgi:hypothetical protein
MTRTDRAILVTACAAVAVLAVVAGAVSYAHMRALADRHGETGWQGHAFPVSVDGIEVVASLVLLADRRLGRRSDVLVWVALAAGTVASMAANVAVAAPDPIGRVVSGWPACALLLAIKLLSGLLGHPPVPRTGPTRLRSGTAPAAVPGRTSLTGPARPPRSGTRRTDTRARTGPDVTDLMPVVRDIHTAVTADGGRLTRALLGDRLRQQGISVSSARLSQALHALTDRTTNPPADAP